MTLITAGLEMTYCSPIKCRYPAVTEATLSAFVSVGVHLAWRRDPSQSTAKRICMGQMGEKKFFANRIVSQLNMFFLLARSLCLCVC